MVKSLKNKKLKKKVSHRLNNKILFYSMFNILNKKRKFYIYFKKNLFTQYVYFFFLYKQNLSFIKFLLYKKKKALLLLNNLTFKLLYKVLLYFKDYFSFNFYEKYFSEKFLSKHYGIVKTFFNFTNTFILLTNVKGEIKNWVSAGTGRFYKRIARSSPQVPISLSFRISNVIQKKKINCIRIKHIGPSKRFRNKAIISLKNRSWVREYKISSIGEEYGKPFNGCRKRRKKRK